MPWRTAQARALLALPGSPVRRACTHAGYTALRGVLASIVAATRTGIGPTAAAVCARSRAGRLRGRSRDRGLWSGRCRARHCDGGDGWLGRLGLRRPRRCREDWRGGTRLGRCTIFGASPRSRAVPWSNRAQELNQGIPLAIRWSHHPEVTWYPMATMPRVTEAPSRVRPFPDSEAIPIKPRATYLWCDTASTIGALRSN
jgi:hypothetical protein